MKLYIWTDRFSYLAVAHTNNVAAARKLMLKTSDLGESGDGSCPERDRARKTILEETPAVYFGEVAEFSLSDSAQLREQEEHSEKLRQQMTAKDRRIAELEAALKRVCADYQRAIDEMATAGVHPSADIAAYFGADYPALDTLLAQARRDTLEYAAREVRSHLHCTQKYASFTKLMPAVERVVNDCADLLEWKAREVKP